MSWTRVNPAVLLLAANCAGAHPTPTLVLSPGAVEEPISAVIAAALQADSQLSTTADSLWAPDATVVANGVLRDQPPRFAGVAPGGEVAITTSRLEVRQSLVWVYLEYRWLSMKDGAARAGRATVLLTRKTDDSGWRIVHLHSSTPPE
jgi:hypothetical protein